MAHVFISYIRENQEQVDRLCMALVEAGVQVWLDREAIQPGTRWKDAIREAIKSGSFFVACFSREYQAKERTFMNEELLLAIEELRQYRTDKVWFVPVLLSECEVPARSIGGGGTLLDLQWVPLYEDFDLGVSRIIAVIRPEERQRLEKRLRTIARRRIARESWIDEEAFDNDPEGEYVEDGELSALREEYCTLVEEFQRRFGEEYDPYGRRFP